jgi:O-acetyl-ADP-ribose deacetylase
MKEVFLSWKRQYRIESIAFPALSTGAFGYPLQDAAEVAFGTIMEMVPGLKSVRRIRFVFYSSGDLAIYEKVLEMKT